MSQKHNLTEGTAFELDKDKKYLIIFNERVVSPDRARELIEGLGKEGFTGLGFMVNGEPVDAVQIVEQDA